MSLFSLLAQLDYSPLPDVTTDSSKLSSILDIVFSITGAIALLIITISGFKYIVSQGNPQQVGQAKNAIIYAAVGLMVSIMAVSIITFVVNKV